MNGFHDHRFYRYLNFPPKLKIPVCKVELTSWGRPSAGSASRRIRRRRACSPSACACAWWGWRTGWTPSRTPRTCAVFRLKKWDLKVRISVWCYQSRDFWYRTIYKEVPTPFPIPSFAIFCQMFWVFSDRLVGRFVSFLLPERVFATLPTQKH